MSDPGVFDDGFDPTHPSVWLIPTPVRQALVLAGMVKLAPIHHLWLERRFSTDEPDRSLAGWSMLPVGLVAATFSIGQDPRSLIVAAAITAIMAMVAPRPWTTYRRHQILRDHGLREPATMHARLAPEDYPLVRLAEVAVVVVLVLAIR